MIKLIFYILILVSSTLTAGCNPFVAGTPMVAAFPSAPEVKPFYDDKWLLMKELVFVAKRESDGKDFKIVVPAGFVNDLASIPIGVNLIFNKTGRYSSAGILHDYLYWTQVCDRNTSDRLIKEALKATGSWYGTRNTIKVGVKLFGWWAWDNNAELRAKKEERYVPAGHRKFGSSEKWDDFRKQFNGEPPWGWYGQQGKTDQPEYCQIFDDTNR